MGLRLFASVAVACIAAGSLASTARADDAPPPLFQLPWGLSLTGHVEAGSTFTTDAPENNIIFGQTFNDRANSIRVNQAMLTLQKALDPKETGYQWGFKLQAMYGTDARVTHFFNEADRITNSPYQFDITEANVFAHLPYWLNGTDVKIGQYTTPIGYEVIDATGNPLYSHSYIFFYGLPFKHTGILTTTHVNDMIDIYLGIDTGNNNSLGDKGMANKEFPKGLLGFGLNGLMGGKLNILALAHIGPEAPRIAEVADGIGGAVGGVPNQLPGANNKVTQIYDAVIGYKVNDNLQWTTELNYIKNDFAGAEGGGAATYLTYTFNDQWSVTGRAEAFADHNGIVCMSTNSLGYVNGQRGLQPAIGYCGNVNTGTSPYNLTYGELTFGATYKPTLPWSQINLAVRPEIRYDSVIGGNTSLRPFNVNAAGQGTRTDQVTLAVDFIVGF